MMMDNYKCTVCGAEVDGAEAFMIRDSKLCFHHYNEGPGKERRAIREGDGIQETWFKSASEIKTPEGLVAFMRSVMNGYVHDYGTVCHAIAACAIAAAWCANNMEGANGGITGFQSGAVFWQFASKWLLMDGPARRLKYEDMLYPQNERVFARRLDKRTAEWLRDEAKKKLAGKEFPAHPDVVAHWKTLAAGKLPFGYEIEG